VPIDPDNRWKISLGDVGMSESLNDEQASRTDLVPVERPAAHGHAFISPFVPEFQLLDLLVREAHYVRWQHHAMLSQLLHLYFSQERNA